MPSILIIDDEPEILEITQFAFDGKGFTVYTASSGEEALQKFQSHRPQILLIDYKLPKMSGLEFLKAARAIDPKVPAIMITGLTEQVEVVKAQCQQLGNATFFQKPIEMESIFDAVKKALNAPPSSSGE